MKRTLVMALLLIFFALFAAPARGNSRWRTYTRLDGLADNFVTSIIEDEGGNMWFGGPAGATKYDTFTWKIFTKKDGLTGDSIISITKDRRGRLWFGTNAGVSKYDGKNWLSFTTKDGLVNDAVTSVIEDAKGHIWFGTSGGVSRYDGTTWRTFTTEDELVNNAVTSIVEGADGHLWVGTYGGVSKYDGETSFNSVDGLASNLVTSMIVDRKGNLWFGTSDGVSKYDGERWTSFNSADGLASDFVTSMLQSKDGNIWAGTTGGVSVYNGKTWTSFTTANSGLVDNAISAIAEDRRGYIWFGTGEKATHTGKGVSRYDAITWTTYNTSTGLPRAEIASIIEDRGGNIWVGTSGGIAVYDKSTWKIFTSAHGLATDWVTSIIEDSKGNIWAGTTAGVSIYSGDTWKTFTKKDGLVNNTVISITEDKEGNIWFGTRKGLSRYDGDTWRKFTTADGLTDNWIVSVIADRNGWLWVGTVDGLSRYNGDTWTSFTIQNGLIDNFVNCVYSDNDGNIWIGTHGGMSKYDGHKWRSFTTQDGLVNNTVSTITEDSDGNLWFGTYGGGVSKYNGMDRWTTYDTADGLVDVWVTSIIEDRYGNLWFGTLNGVSKFVPDKVPPETRIVEGPQEGETVNTSSVLFQYKGGDWKTETLRLKYIYKLSRPFKMDDEDWSDSSYETSKTYYDLENGRHTFSVAAIDGDGNIDMTPATLSFMVAPPIKVEVKQKELYASLYRRYDKIEPIAYIYLRNKHSEPLTVTVSLSVEGYISEPKLIEHLSLPSSQSPEDLHGPIPLFVALPEKILKVSQYAKIPATIVVEYEGVRRFQPAKQTIDLFFYPSGKVPYSDYESVEPYVAFISKDDKIVRDFASHIAGKYKPSEMKRVLPPDRYTKVELNAFNNLFLAMAIYETLNTAGFYYVPDPNAPYGRLEERKPGEVVIDDVRYPREFLTSDNKGGDCDDWAILYSALLESVGIPTALVDIPGHVFVMFDTGIHERSCPVLSLPENRYIKWNNSIWIPVDRPQQPTEPTGDFDDSFATAWQNGLRQYHNYDGQEGNRRIVKVKEAHKKYPPSFPPGEPLPPDLPETSEVDKLITDDLNKLYNKQKEYDISQKERLGIPMSLDDKLALLNERGISAGLKQMQEEAKQMFNQALELNKDFAPSYNNLGNLYFTAGDFEKALNMYKKTRELDHNDPGLLLNLALTHLALGHTQEAVLILQHALEQLGSINKACYQLAIPVKRPQPPGRVPSAFVDKLYTILEKISQGDSIEGVNLTAEDVRGASVGIYWKR